MEKIFNDFILIKKLYNSTTSETFNFMDVYYIPLLSECELETYREFKKLLND